MKFLLYPAIIIIICALQVRCKKVRENSLVIQLLSEPEGLHPINGTSVTGAEINLYTHLSLLKINYKTGELLPCLAKNLPIISKDGLSYSYEIKDNMTWDDNSTISANDIVFTVKANKCLFSNNAGSKTSWDNIKDISINNQNNKRFTVIMKRPYILNTWFWTDFPIIQEGFYDKQKTLSKYSIEQLSDSTFLKTKPDIKQWVNELNNPKYYSDPDFINGAGPYKITNWNKGVSITLEKKQNHWSENCQENWFCEANPDKIIFKLNANNASAVSDLKNEQVDVSTVIKYAAFTELSHDENFTKKFITKLGDTYNYTYVAMNMKPDGNKHQKLFNDINVRKAMALLTPYEQLNKILYENHNKRMIGPVSSNKIDFNTELKPIEYNIEKAKELLTKAGWADTDNDQILDKMIDGKKVKLEFAINFIAGSKAWEDLAKQLAESMTKVNIYAMLNPLDYPKFLNSAITHDFDMNISAWQGSAQPDDFSQLWHSSSWTNNGLNFTGFGNAQSDALIDSINSTVDERIRIKLSKRFQKLVYDEQPYIYLFTKTQKVIVNKKWSNLDIYAEYPGVLLNTLKLNN